MANADMQNTFLRFEKKLKYIFPLQTQILLGLD